MPVALATALALVAFAANSLLCRIALRDTAIDPSTFTLLRIAGGAAALWAIARRRGGARSLGGRTLQAAGLFAYAILFSLAYVSMTAATGALLLFGAANASMIAAGLARGDRLRPLQWAGFAIAVAGLLWLLAPGWAAPPPWSAAAMIAAGVSWTVYQMAARPGEDPTAATAGNFARALPFAAAVALASLPWASIDARGAGYAIASGVVTSGIGYAIWFVALRGLAPTIAATLQLATPAIAMAGAVAWLDEPLHARQVGASALLLGGIAVVVLSRRPR